MAKQEKELTVEDKLKALYELQTVDSKIDELRILAGELPQEVTDMGDIVEGLKTRFQAPYLRYTRALTPEVQTIALCGGAGAEFADEAIAQGADVFITADVKYHEMQAADGRIALVDMDHWVSEHFTRNIFQDLLHPHLPADCPTYISTADQSPVNLL